MNDQILLSVEGLSKSYHTGNEELKILQDVDFELNAGSICALYGASGSGKSTFLHLLGGLDQPDQGRIRLNGMEIHHLSDEGLSELRRTRISYVFQFHHLLTDFTALENVQIPLLIRGESITQSIKKSEQIMDIVGIMDRKDHKPSELSGGERQRVAIARALVTQPCLVLADEPTGNLDQENAGRLLNLIVDLNSRLNQTFLIATHDPEVSSIAHQKYQIKQKTIHRMS
ncbi:MAG: ABC transporter ATP-binding protein [Candidatus Delongbacteria bacterium]|nr:ABC transporter ATP-binding protein [Candidatus Delongbacteria bacterium]